MSRISLNPQVAAVLKPAYAPCPAFAGPCYDMRWEPSAGHVPRGFRGAAGTLGEIELVLVYAEPGDPHAGETHEGLLSAYDYSTQSFILGTDLFHRNVRSILDSCWPGIPLTEQLRRVWMTESVLCSAPKEGGPVRREVSNECGKRYLLKQLDLLPNALVVALGNKARDRLHAIGFTTFMAVKSVAPPGCNFRGARESWAEIAVNLRRGQLSSRGDR